MEAIVHLDHPAAMPSQSQMAYAPRTTALHRDRGPLQESLEHYQRFLNRPTQGGPGDGCPYKPQQSQGQVQQQGQGQGQGGGQGPGQGGQGTGAGQAGGRPAYPPAAYRYIPQSPYASGPPPAAAPNPAPAPAPTPAPPPPPPLVYRDNIYTSSRSAGVIGDRTQNIDMVRGETLASQLRPPRISLLPTPGEYLSAVPRSRLHQSDGYRESMVASTGGTPVLESPVKKIRLGEPKPDVQQALRIDTRDESQPTAAYNPQVEAISPTLPSEVLQEDANFRSTKDELLHGIAKIDSEISKTEQQISKLRKIQQELEEAAKKPVPQKEEEEVPQPQHQSPAQKIYAENRKKAQEAHALLENLGPKIELPLYNQPSDTAVYHENKRRHLVFKMKLLEHLRRKHIERENREKVLSATYSRLVQEWLRKVEKVENSQKRKAKEAKNREFFEKVFPKLRKQREDRERFNRVGARIKSEADLEEIMDGLQEQELEDKKMRSYAVVPPLLLDAKQRSVYYVNNNGRLDDFASEYKERQLLNVWTDAEKEIFKEKFLQHPKNFGVIASCLDRKNVCDCVQYYYLSKKAENYKSLLRKSRQRTRTRTHAKVNSSVTGPGNNLDILNSGTGVTTRLQKEQLQKQEAPPSQPPPENTEVPSTDCDNTHDSSFLIEPSSQTDTSLLLTAHSNTANEIKMESKKKDRRKEEKKKKEEDLAETTDEEQFEQGGVDCSGGVAQACAVCKAESVCWRALPRSQASQYGLSEEQVPPDARVCNLCRCKAVRSRYTNCPLPTCPNAKGHRVKRLRPIPCKWPDLPPHIKDPIAAEFQIDKSITKCCSACFNRIMRRIGVVVDGSGGTVTEEGQALSPSQSSQMLRWTDEEIDALKKGIRNHGTRWSEVSQIVGPTKSQHQCKNFFFNYRKKLGLDQLVQDYNKAHLGEERKPALTDEEESGSSTSSCDEIEAGAGGDSDTASAASPTQNQDEKPNAVTEEVTTVVTVNPKPSDQSFAEEIRDNQQIETSERIQDPSLQLKVGATVPIQANKEDYDSSATETADEGQGGGETEPCGPRPVSPKHSQDDDQSPLTVKDLMHGFIEMQLMKNQGQQNQSGAPAPAGPPTISSILNSDTFPQRDKQPRPQEVTNSPLATLSVVTGHHSHPPPQDLNKESLVVMQAIREPREQEPVTLDLSIKKPRESNISQVTKTLSQHQLPSQQSHNIFRSTQPPPEQPPFYQQVVPPKLSPKLSPGILTPGTAGCSSGMHGSKTQQCGSIIHGTPVSSPNIYNQSRYDQSATTLIRQVTPPHKETGSITQGTPVHQRTSMYPGHSAEYFAKRTLAGNFYAPRPPAYSVEQRQIIMNDYITSQQMHGGTTGSPASRNTREKIYYPPSTRQGVIQRHNPKPPSPGIGHYPPPGHEALSSLVDVAVRQPSLPVPPPPITISLPEHKSITTEEKRHLHEGLGERFNRESPHERYSSREQDRYSRDNHKTHGPSAPTRDSHHQQQQHQIRDQQIRDQQMRDLHQIRENHQQQLQQHHRELHQQQQLQHLHKKLDLIHAQQQKLRENQMQHIQQQLREMEQQGPRHQIQNYQPRLIHDPHHTLERLIQVSGGFPREPQPPPPSQQPPVSRAHSNSDQGVEGSGRGRSGGESSTLTAASLIDAIITHQINQSSDGPNANITSGACATPQSQPTRPGDRLFQGFHRDGGPESNGKLSPMKQGVSPDPKSHGLQIAPTQAQGQPMPEHIDVFSSSASQGSRPGAYQGYDAQTWKLRRALQHKDVEPPQREKNEDRNIVRYYPDPQTVSLSPLDYVNNRIVEVMRTGEEGTTKSSDSPSASEMVIDESDTPVCQPSAPPSFISTSHTYTYPYSALSLSTGTTGVTISNQNVVKTGSEPVPEQPPLLSAQYEPLSDED